MTMKQSRSYGTVPVLRRSQELARRGRAAVVAVALAGATAACGGSGAPAAPHVTRSESAHAGTATPDAPVSAAGAASAAAAAHPTGQGSDCGQVGTAANGGSVHLVVTGGQVNCALALKVWADYQKTPGQGSGDFATVDSVWNCSVNSYAGQLQSGVIGGCSDGPRGFMARSVSAVPSPGGSVVPLRAVMNGTDLAAVLAGLSTFPQPVTAAQLHTHDSGNQFQVQQADPGASLRTTPCADQEEAPASQDLGIAEADRTFFVTSFFSAGIVEFQDPSTASRYVSDWTSMVRRCGSVAPFARSTLGSGTVAGLSAATLDSSDVHLVVLSDGPDVITVDATTAYGQPPPTSTPPQSVAAEIVAALQRG